MRSPIQPAIVMFVLLSLVTGVAYPLVVTLGANTLFPQKATGSLLREGDRNVGSELLGQSFDDPQYFWGRPSATGPVPYNGLGGSGSNQATTNPALVDAVRDRVARLREADPGNQSSIPVDLVTASASGLDPHISPAAAQYQMSRVARVRHLSLNQIEALINQHIEQPTFGVLGQPRVHVLKLNLALNSAK